MAGRGCCLTDSVQSTDLLGTSCQSSDTLWLEDRLDESVRGHDVDQEWF